MMSAARFESVHQGLTSTARKVFECVPIAEIWSAQRVHAELLRLGVNIGFRVLLGCLRDLVQAGLVNEPEPGRVKRAPIRPRADPPVLVAVAASPIPPTDSTMPQQPAPTPAPSSHKPDAMDRIGLLAGRLRALVADAGAIAADLESLAIEIGERDQANVDALEKLATLRALLKG